MDPRRDVEFENVGRNVRFRSKRHFVPRNKREVRAILEAHRAEMIRVIGSRHSWSEAAVSTETTLDLTHFNAVVIDDRGDEPTARVGAGCTIERVVAELAKHGLALPTYGMIGKQTIAGAIATATHGSGASSLAHYVVGMRLAVYDADRTARIVELTTSDGLALEAARCALGRMGAILEVRMRCVRAFRVEERSEWRADIVDALEDFRDFPLSHLYLMPWAWTFVVQRRRVTDRPRSRGIVVRWYRLLRASLLCVVNCGTYCAIRLPLRKRIVACLYRFLAYRVWPNVVVDRAENILMISDTHRYLEAEIFVPIEHAAAAARLIEDVLRVAGGEMHEPTRSTRALIARAPHEESLDDLASSYMHHYPITFRSVRKDDTLISMSSDEAMMAISLITMERGEAAIARFERVVTYIARTLVKTCRARLHWGKIYPASVAADIAASIPNLRSFAEQCRQVDPDDVFSNEYTHRVLGF